MRPLRLPKAAEGSTRVFASILPSVAGVTERKLFGQPAGFLRGHLFLGVFGEEVFVRLSAEDRAEALKIPGAHRFEPMPGRPMAEYVVLPRATLDDGVATRRWVERSVRYVGSLPAKKPAARTTRK